MVLFSPARFVAYDIVDVHAVRALTHHVLGPVQHLELKVFDVGAHEMRIREFNAYSVQPWRRELPWYSIARLVSFVPIRVVDPPDSHIRV